MSAAVTRPSLVLIVNALILIKAGAAFFLPVNLACRTTGGCEVHLNPYGRRVWYRPPLALAGPAVRRWHWSGCHAHTSTSSYATSASENNSNVNVDHVPTLSNRVAVVTGASRGIGRGVALELGRAGMVVYVVGRSSRQQGGATTERDLGDNVDMTVERTAEDIDAAPGVGRGVPVACDVSSDEEVAKLMARVREEAGRLDALVCSAFTTPPDLNDASFRDDFWRQGAPMWDACHRVGLRGSYMACCEAAPLMIATAKMRGGDGDDDSRPLIALISSFGGKSYTFNVAYGVGKAGTDRLASDMGVQLLKHGVDTVALYPGVVRTEGNVAMDERGEWEAASGGLDLNRGESPRFTGRAIARLLAEPEFMAKRSGNVVVVAELAKDMGFTDIDGSTPPSIRSLKFILPSFVFPQIEKERGMPLPKWVVDNVPDYLLPWSVFSSGPPPTTD